jgi:hypothetical protein
MKPTDSDEYRARLRRAVAQLAAVRRFAARYGLAVGVFKSGDEWRISRTGNMVVATWWISTMEFEHAGGTVTVKNVEQFKRAVAESLNPLG